MLSSIDATIVRQVFGGDSALFESLVTRLLQEYADLAVPVLDLADYSPGSRDELQRWVHKLKGSEAHTKMTRMPPANPASGNVR